MSSPPFSGMQSGGHIRRDDVHFVEQEQPAVAHGQGKRAVFIGHAAVFQTQMADQIGKFQAAMSRHFKDGIFQTGGKLSDAAAFAAAGRAEEVEGIFRSDEPDDHVPACFGEAEMRIDARRERGGVGVSPHDGSRGLAAENQTRVTVHGLQAGEFFLKCRHGATPESVNGLPFDEKPFTLVTV